MKVLQNIKTWFFKSPKEELTCPITRITDIENNVNQIEFNRPSNWKYIEPIVPAIAALPQWYKDKKPEVTGSMPYERHTGTIKACPAMFDSMVQGYIMPLWTDLYVQPSDETPPVPQFWWGDGIKAPMSPYLLKRFDVEMTEGMPTADKTNLPAFKIDSPWVLTTPKGYSTLFISPFNNADSLFEPFSGVIHTDIFSTYIKVLTLWKGPEDFKGIIKAGTPLVQMIPFKRESFQHNLGIITPEEDDEEQACFNAVSKLGFTSLYRKLFSPFNRSYYK